MGCDLTVCCERKGLDKNLAVGLGANNVKVGIESWIIVWLLPQGLHQAHQLETFTAAMGNLPCLYGPILLVAPSCVLFSRVDSVTSLSSPDLFSIVKNIRS